MPRVTPQQIALRALTAATQRIRQLFIVLNADKLLDCNFGDLNEHNASFVALLLYECELKRLRSTRYVTPREHQSYTTWICELDLRKEDGDVPWLSDREFFL